MKNNNYTIQSFISELKLFREKCPIIKEFCENKLLCKKDLDIFEKENSADFLPAMNATNMINIVNFLWDIFFRKYRKFYRILIKIKYLF